MPSYLLWLHETQQYQKYHLKRKMSYVNDQSWRLKLFISLEPLGWGCWCGAGTLSCGDILPKFLSTTCGYETSPFCFSAPPTSPDGCGFFNSVVVRLPFSLISDGSEWWLFYILVVILIWLCKKVSCVCIRHHLDWKLSLFFQ